MSFLPISTSRNPILKSLLKKLCYITENFTQSGKGKVAFTNLAHFWLRFLFEMYPKIHFPLTFSSPEKPRKKSAISRPLSHLNLVKSSKSLLMSFTYVNVYSGNGAPAVKLINYIYTYQYDSESKRKRPLCFRL